PVNEYPLDALHERGDGKSVVGHVRASGAGAAALLAQGLSYVSWDGTVLPLRCTKVISDESDSRRRVPGGQGSRSDISTARTVLHHRRGDARCCYRGIQRAEYRHGG